MEMVGKETKIQVQTSKFNFKSSGRQKKPAPDEVLLVICNC